LEVWQRWPANGAEEVSRPQEMALSKFSWQAHVANLLDSLGVSREGLKD
jgi:hypothetical protein